MGNNYIINSSIIIITQNISSRIESKEFVDGGKKKKDYYGGLDEQKHDSDFEKEEEEAKILQKKLLKYKSYENNAMLNYLQKQSLNEKKKLKVFKKIHLYR